MQLKPKVTSAGVFAAAAAAAVLTARPALATVTFDPATGTGFVGKGDVQTAFDWNNQQLQSKAAGVTLAYDTTTHYSATCEWVTGAGTKGQKTHDITLSRHSGVNSTVAYDARVKTQITGVTLKGFGDSTTDGIAPGRGPAVRGQRRRHRLQRDLDLGRHRLQNERAVRRIRRHQRVNRLKPPSYATLTD